jgi:hypothetical protein
VPYIIALLTPIFFSFLLNLINVKTNFWSKFGYWRKYLVLIFSYLANHIFFLVILFFSESRNLVDYFGGDAGGSFSLFYFPVGLLILAGGLVFFPLTKLRKQIKK